MKNKFTKISFILLMTILIILSLFYITKNNVKAETSNSNPIKTTGSLKNVKTGEWEATNRNEYNLPTYGNYEIYCIYPEILVNYDYGITYEKAKQLSGKTYRSSCGCPNLPYNGYKTPPVFKDAGTGTLSPAAAYIVSDEPEGKWSAEKQRALWNLKSKGLDGGLIIGSGKPYNPKYAGTSIYDKEAEDYSKYYTEITKNNDLKNGTDSSKVTTQVDTTAKKYTIGPLKVNYTNGIYGNIAFAGISKITVVGYNKDGKVVKSDIKVEKFIVGNKEQTLECFEADKLLVDTTKQAYPKSNEKFSIVFSDPNSGITADNANYVSKVRVKVKYQYMLAEGNYSKLVGYKYTVQYKHNETYDHKDTRYFCTHTEYPPVHNSSCLKKQVSHYSCKARCYLQQSQQQTLASATAIRKLYEKEIDLGIEQKLTMSLSGQVWVDGSLDDKQNTPYNGLSGDKNDVVLPNVRVILYNKAGKQISEKLTNSNGRYTFEPLNAMERYYVAFEYNGQLYMPTTYSKPSSTSANWAKTSKATEKTADRNSLNSKFAKIDAYPNNYKNGKVFSMHQLVSSGVIDSLYAIKDGVIVDVNYLNKATKTPTAEQTKFMNDCKIKAYTMSQGSSSYDLYPATDKFTLNSADISSINLGLVKRSVNDLALRNDVYRAVTKINEKTEVYKYSRQADENQEGYWDISVRLSDANYYNTSYNRAVYSSDYNYKSSTAHNGAELEIFVTYKITIRNQSQGIVNTVNEVTNYYDKEYTYRKDLSWVTYNDNAFEDEQYYKAIHNENLKEIKNAKSINSTNKNNVISVKGLSSNKLGSGETEYIYLTFEVNKDRNGKVTLDNNDIQAKYNVTEINGYTSYYKNGTTLPNKVSKSSRDKAGMLDIDSVPGNINKSDLRNEKNYEDDTDRAKGLRIVLNTTSTRQISGTVWEDLRTQIVENSIIGDGIRNENTGIGDIRVQLIEILKDGKEYIWTTTTLGGKNQEKTNADGTYIFKDFIPGDYIIRFTYGGEYNSKYNGQDYKSTIYQKGVNQTGKTNFESSSNTIVNSAQSLNQKVYYGYTNVENQNTSKSYGYSISKSSNSKLSDAKDIWSYRENANKYSSNNYQGVTNQLAERLANSNTANASTQMVAETGVIVIETEYNTIITDAQSQEYHIADVDFGLTERPKAQLELNKHVENLRIVLANGTTLYDAKETVPNLGWIKGKSYDLRNDSGKYYKYNRTNSSYTYSANQADINTLVNSLYKSGRNGLIQAIMDSELMHGATITIQYKLTLKNVGEVDYTGKAFYYKGEKSGDVVTTSGDLVVDYVANNLQYRESDNSGWSIVNIQDLDINNSVKSAAKNKIILQTTEFKKNLKPGEKVEKNLVLSQTITAQNSSDDMTYDNIAEITKYSNSVGRKMAYSIVGNQDPTKAPAEVDTAKAEKVIILPPFGQVYLYLGIGVISAVILAIGVILIKKKALKK